MSAVPRPVAILQTGLVTSVGLSAPATCAAIRAAVTNHTETRFIGAGGEWIVAAQVPLDQPWRGREKLVQMLALAVGECIEPCGPPEPRTLPLLLCVAERTGPGASRGWTTGCRKNSRRGPASSSTRSSRRWLPTGASVRPSHCPAPEI